MLASNFNAKPEGYEPAPLEITRTLVTAPRYGAELPSDTIEPISWIEGVSEFTWYEQLAFGAVDFIETVPQPVAGLRTEIINQNKDALLYGFNYVSNALSGRQNAYAPSSALFKSIEEKGIAATGLSVAGGVVQGTVSPLKAFFSYKQDYREIGYSLAEMAAGYGAGKVIGRLSRGSVMGTASHHQTKHLWVDNADGARTIEQAIAITEQHGVYIPDDVRFRPISDEFLDSNGLNVDAYYGNFKNISPSTLITWRPQPKALPLTDKDGVFNIFIRESILRSDRAIVGIMEHELSELEGLLSVLAKKGGITAAEYKRLVEPGHKDNLHWEAVDRGDKLVRDMIENGF